MPLCVPVRLRANFGGWRDRAARPHDSGLTCFVGFLRLTRNHGRGPGGPRHSRPGGRRYKIIAVIAGGSRWRRDYRRGESVIIAAGHSVRGEVVAVAAVAVEDLLAFAPRVALRWHHGGLRPSVWRRLGWPDRAQRHSYLAAAEFPRSGSGACSGRTRRSRG